MIEKNKNFIIIALFFILTFTIHSSLTFELDSNIKNNSIIPKQRIKRHLSFQNGTRILFRVNIKDNIIKVNQIFAHAFGFRANIDLLQPPQLYTHHRIARRDVYQAVEQLMTKQGLDGRACIFKMFCDAAKGTVEENGMFSKLFKLIFTHKDSSEYGGVDIPFLLSNGCQHLHNFCPLSLLDLSPYTDV